jgi:anti-anti-sigma factor
VTDVDPETPATPRPPTAPRRASSRSDPGDVRVIRLSGVLDARSGRHLDDVLTAVLVDAPVGVVIDLSGVERLDRDGARLLILVRRLTRQLGATLPVVGATPAVTAALHNFHVAGLLQFYPTATAAIDAVRRRFGRSPRQPLQAPSGPHTDVGDVPVNGFGSQVASFRQPAAHSQRTLIPDGAPGARPPLPRGPAMRSHPDVPPEIAPPRSGVIVSNVVWLSILTALAIVAVVRVAYHGVNDDVLAWAVGSYRA